MIFQLTGFKTGLGTCDFIRSTDLCGTLTMNYLEPIIKIILNIMNILTMQLKDSSANSPVPGQPVTVKISGSTRA